MECESIADDYVRFLDYLIVLAAAQMVSSSPPIISAPKTEHIMGLLHAGLTEKTVPLLLETGAANSFRRQMHVCLSTSMYAVRFGTSDVQYPRGSATFGCGIAIELFSGHAQYIIANDIVRVGDWNCPEKRQEDLLSKDCFPRHLYEFSEELFRRGI